MQHGASSRRRSKSSFIHILLCDPTAEVGALTDDETAFNRSLIAYTLRCNINNWLCKQSRPPFATNPLETHFSSSPVLLVEVEVVSMVSLVAQHVLIHVLVTGDCCSYFGLLLFLCLSVFSEWQGLHYRHPTRVEVLIFARISLSLRTQEDLQCATRHSTSSITS